MPNTIADAIVGRNSIYQFADCYRDDRIASMDDDADMEYRRAKLKALVDECGGPAEFSRDRTSAIADKPIDPTYVSQIINKHRPFRERAVKNMIRRAGLPEDYFDVPRAKIAQGNVLDFPSSIEEHPAISEVVRLMLETDDPGRWMLLERAKVIAAERPRVAKKTQ